MARNERTDIKRYFAQKKAETDRASELVSQREKTVLALQRAVEEKYRVILEQEAAFAGREKKQGEKEKALIEREQELKKQKELYDAGIHKWEQEQQDLMVSTRTEIEILQNEIQALRNELMREKAENTALKETIAQLKEERGRLLKKLL